MTDNGKSDLNNMNSSACECAIDTNKKDDVSVEMDPELNAVDDLLPSPTRNPKVGNQSHNRDSKKPEEEKWTH